MEVSAGRSKETYNDPSAPASETNLSWHQTTVVSVMEAGGLNWLLGKVCSFSFVYDIFELWFTGFNNNALSLNVQGI